jgi:Flp pilus assembly protein TadG
MEVMLDHVLEAIRLLLAAFGAFFASVSVLASMRANRAAEATARLASTALKELKKRH